MSRLKRRIDQREQILATGLRRRDGANKIREKLQTEAASQLELEHIRVMLWLSFLEDLTDCRVDVVPLLGKREKLIFYEAVALLQGEANWDYSPHEKMN